MAVFHKFDVFVDSLGTKVHDLVADTLKVYLTNTQPNASTHAIKADLPEIVAGNGYPSGGEDAQNGGSESGGVLTITGADVIFTASGGSVGPFRYAVLYNDTAPDDPLIGWWDRGSSLTLNDGEFQTVAFSGDLLTVI